MFARLENNRRNLSGEAFDANILIVDAQCACKKTKKIIIKIIKDGRSYVAARDTRRQFHIILPSPMLGYSHFTENTKTNHAKRIK